MQISYAQNFEDVILWRALGRVEGGFYIDVGAQDPVVDSVSLAFYEKGWRGVHVEPTPHYASLLRVARPDEEVIEAAIGEDATDLTFYEIPDTGLSTSDATIAEIHRRNGFEVVERRVALMPLSQLFRRIGDREIHWLKIDVEGMEAAVIASWGSATARPWVVVVESTLPNTQIATHEEWEPVLNALGYVFAYMDGLNRFYVHETHGALLGFFGAGPHFFDGFAISENSPFASHLNGLICSQSAQIETTTKELERVRGDLADTRSRLDAQSAQIETTTKELERVRGDLADARSRLDVRLGLLRGATSIGKAGRTTAIRLSEPFGAGTSRVLSVARRIGKSGVLHVGTYLARYPKVRQAVGALLRHRLPRFHAKVRRLMYGESQDSQFGGQLSGQYLVAKELPLSPRARKVLDDLAALIVDLQEN